MYLDAIVKALGKEFQARILTLDPSFELERVQPPAPDPSKEEDLDLWEVPVDHIPSKRDGKSKYRRGKLWCVSIQFPGEKSKYSSSHATLGRILRHNFGGSKLSDYKGRIQYTNEWSVFLNQIRSDDIF